MKKLYLISIALLLIILACEKPKHYPKEPQIDFSKIYIVDTLDLLGNPVKLHSFYFNVIDGDADFGLEEKDTLGVFDADSLYNNNLFISTYSVTNGVLTKIETDFALSFRVPKTNIVDLNNYFKAEVKVDLSYPLDIYNSLPNLDTIVYSFYVVDKSFNLSNVENSLKISRTDYGFIIDTTIFIPKQL